MPSVLFGNDGQLTARGYVPLVLSICLKTNCTFKQEKLKTFPNKLLKNPYVEISCFDGEKWLRLEAEAIEDDRFKPNNIC